MLVSQTTEISSGKIEHGSIGNGPAVLISHGTLGGYDQGYAISQLFSQEKFKFLCVSRAGYQNSSPTSGRTPEEQAASYIQLLDKEEISEVAIIGTSGGAPSALQFAQEYPDRCWALILISSISQMPELPPFFQYVIRMQDFMMRIDPLWVFVHKYGLKFLMRSNGVNSEQIKEIFKDTHLHKVVKGLYKPIKTASSRRKGVRLDDAQIKSLCPIESYDIQVPTYISHATNDPLAPVKDAQKLASVIRNAKYYESSDGGHIFFVVHHKEVISDIEQFMLQNCGS